MNGNGSAKKQIFLSRLLKGKEPEHASVRRDASEKKNE